MVVEVFVPVCTRGKYLQRLRAFKLCGFFSPPWCQKHPEDRFHLKLGVTESEYENYPDINRGWSNLFDTVSVVCCPHSGAASKVHNYYSQLGASGFQADWYLRVDDDSVTNLIGLVDIVRKLPCEKQFFFCGAFVEGDVSVEKKLFERFDVTLPCYQHEVEVLFSNRSAMAEGFGFENNKELIQHRSQQDRGYTDILLTLLAKRAGIFPQYLGCLTDQPHLSHLFAGDKHHIHFLAPDVNKDLFRLYQSLLARPSEHNCQFIGSETDPKTILWNDRTYTCDFYFEKGVLVLNTNCYELEHLLRFRNSIEFFIFGRDGSLTGVFVRQDQLLVPREEAESINYQCLI